MQPDRSAICDRGFVALIVALSLTYLGAFLYFVQATVIREPFSDMLDYIDDYLAFRRNGDFWTYLWSPHTQHRLIWTRLVAAIDIDLFNGITYPFVVTSTACLVMVALLMQREAAKASTSPVAKLIGVLSAVMLVFTANNAVDCSVAIESIYPHAVVFAVLSLVLFNDSEPSAGWAIAKWGAALLAAIGAAFGNATGLVVWPILVWMAWRKKLDWQWLLATAGIGAAFLAIYAHGLPIPQSTTEATSGEGEFYAPAHLYKIAIYLLSYMGLPWTRAPALADVGRAIGAILLVVSGFVVVQRGIVRGPADRLERLSIGLIIFSLGTSALATLGRVDEDFAAKVPVRYSLFLTPLHIGLLFLGLPWLNRCWHDRSRRRLCQVGILVVFALLLVQQIEIGRAAIRTTDTIRATIDRFLSGERQPEMVSLLGNLDNAQRIVNLTREKKIYIVGRGP